MKESRRFAGLALLPVLMLLLSGCETVQWSTDSSRRFEEEDKADVVLRFSRWDYISISQPDYREQGFLRQLQREDLRRAFDDLHLRRDTAVVVVGWTYQAEVLDRLVTDWKSILKENGFRRFVCLRGAGHSKINGLQIIDDANLSTVETNRTARL